MRTFPFDFVCLSVKTEEKKISYGDGKCSYAIMM